MAAGEEIGLLEGEILRKAGLAVFRGDASIHSLALVLAAGRAKDRPILVLDGGNRFDPYLLSDLARLSGVDPDLFLSRVLVSRAFTCHQVHRMVRTGLPQALREHAPAVIVGLALDLTFHDGQIPNGEARRLWREVLDVLSTFSKTAPVLTTAESPPGGGRPWITCELLRRARYRFRVERRGENILVVRESPQGGAWVWSFEA